MEKSSANTGDRRRFNALKELDLPRYVLLPGDPDRVRLMAGLWDDARQADLPRGYTAASGTYRGARIGAVSTMIGAPSLDIVYADVAQAGADTFIRVGTCGTLREDISTNSLIINDAAVRLDGTSQFYVRKEFPAVASHEVTYALVDAAANSGAAYRVGTGATSGSFFAGQGRPAFNGYQSQESHRILEEMKQAGVLNFEMETAALLTLSRLFGFRAGAVCSVIANRITNEWGDSGGIELACRVASEAVALLSRWDARAEELGQKNITPNITAIVTD